ncbi:MAG: hypothetical protein AAFO96_29655, partial [Bacteroidota bacterium]
MRVNGLTVHDTPQQFDSSSTHSVIAPGCTIPLHLQGVISTFETTPPNDDDIANLPRIVMTSSAPWSPTSSILADTEHRQNIASIHRGNPN